MQRFQQLSWGSVLRSIASPAQFLKQTVNEHFLLGELYVPRPSPMQLRIACTPALLLATGSWARAWQRSRNRTGSKQPRSQVLPFSRPPPQRKEPGKEARKQPLLCIYVLHTFTEICGARNASSKHNSYARIDIQLYNHALVPWLCARKKPGVMHLSVVCPTSNTWGLMGGQEWN